MTVATNGRDLICMQSSVDKFEFEQPKEQKALCMENHDRCMNIIDNIVIPMYNQLVGGQNADPLLRTSSPVGDKTGKIICAWRYPNDLCAVSFCVQDPEFGYTLWIWEPENATRQHDPKLFFPEKGAPLHAVYELLGQSLLATIRNTPIGKGVWGTQPEQAKERESHREPKKSKISINESSDAPHSSMLNPPEGWTQ